MVETWRRLQEEFADRGFYGPYLRAGVVQECDHPGVPTTVEPAFKQAITDGVRSMKLRVFCPDCSWELDVRFWQAEAGEWHVRLQERLAARRMWIFRCERERWIAGM